MATDRNAREMIARFRQAVFEAGAGDDSPENFAEIIDAQTELFAALAAPSPTAAALAAPPVEQQAAVWLPIESAPRDGTPILGWCVHGADPYYDSDERRLTDYGASAEGMSHAKDGLNIVSWCEGQDESTHEWSVPKMPDWWFIEDGDYETAANPTHWMPVPPAPTEQPAAQAAPARTHDDLDDSDLDDLVTLLGRHEREEIGHRGLIAAIVARFPVAAPPTEQPAAQALALIVDALEHSTPTHAHYPEPRARHSAALAAARSLTAPVQPAPQAGAAEFDYAAVEEHHQRMRKQVREGAAHPTEQPSQDAELQWLTTDGRSHGFGVVQRVSGAVIRHSTDSLRAAIAAARAAQAQGESKGGGNG